MEKSFYVFEKFGFGHMSKNINISNKGTFRLGSLAFFVHICVNIKIWGKCTLFRSCWKNSFFTIFPKISIFHRKLRLFEITLKYRISKNINISTKTTFIEIILKKSSFVLSSVNINDSTLSTFDHFEEIAFVHKSVTIHASKKRRFFLGSLWIVCHIIASFSRLFNSSDIHKDLNIIDKIWGRSLLPSQPLINCKTFWFWPFVCFQSTKY